MNVLVTGGAGYIGSVTVDHLVAAGERVTVLDNLSHGSSEAVNSEANLVIGDIGDIDLVTQLGRDNDIDGVIHFAGYISVAESVSHPELYLRNNIELALRMAEALRACGIDKVVFSSSAAVYGTPTVVPIPEDHPKAPSSPYGWTKLAFEQALGFYDTAHGLRSVSLRYFNACGATIRREQHEPETHLIPLVLEVAAGKRAHIKVFGDDYDTPDGTCIRDYVDVSDLARAHLAALRYLSVGGATTSLNLGTGRGFSVLDVIDAARQVTGHPIPTVIEGRRSGDPSVLVASSDQARRVLGWEPEVTGLTSIIESVWNST